MDGTPQPESPTASAKGALLPGQTRWKCTVAYDGTAFDGWQSQESGNTIQDVLERRLQDIFKAELRLHGSGRTDAGVHALAQVFHFDAAWPHGTEKLRRALQATLPEAIRIGRVQRVKPDFHARFSARGKVYRYHVCLGEADPFTTAYRWSVDRPLDFAAMEAAAAELRGRREFWAFSGENDRTYATTVRDLRRLEIRRRGRELTFTYEADGFLYKMVRSLTGALVNVGLGRLTPADIAELIRTRRRIPTVVTAPPRGLFLVKVLY